MDKNTDLHNPAYPLHPRCTPSVRTPPLIPPECVHPPLAGDAPQDQIVEGVLFVLKQHGFNGVVAPVNEPKLVDFVLCKFIEDYADLNENDFASMIRKVRSIKELEGLANRKSALKNRDLKSWSEFQRAAIIHRKYEIKKEEL